MCWAGSVKLGTRGCDGAPPPSMRRLQRMTRDEYRAEIERLKRECLVADIERTMRSWERVGLAVSKMRDGKQAWTMVKFADEEVRRRLDLLDDMDDIEDPAAPIRQRIAEVQIDYVYEWLRQDRDWWTPEQMAEECEDDRGLPRCQHQQMYQSTGHRWPRTRRRSGRAGRRGSPPRRPGPRSRRGSTRTPAWSVPPPARIQLPARSHLVLTAYTPAGRAADAGPPDCADRSRRACRPYRSCRSCRSCSPGRGCRDGGAVPPDDLREEWQEWHENRPIARAQSRPATRVAPVAPVVRPPGSPLEATPRGGDDSPDGASAC